MTTLLERVRNPWKTRRSLWFQTTFWKTLSIDFSMTLTCLSCLDLCRHRGESFPVARFVWGGVRSSSRVGSPIFFPTAEGFSSSFGSERE